MSLGWKEAAGGLGAAAVGALVAVLVTGVRDRAADPAATGAAVRAYLLDHPEILPEAMERLQDRQTASAIAANREAVTVPFDGAVAGNPKGDVTLTEYFDYACGYCRQSVADVDRLVAGDPKLRVVYKELPILDGEISGRAAQMSLAAARQGRFLAFHHALYGGSGPLSDARIDAAAKTAGVAATGLDGAGIVDEINANLATARALRISGTPTFVVGNRMLSGAVGYQALKDAIAGARAAPKA